MTSNSCDLENFYLINREITFHIPVRVSYDSDLEKVERVSIEVAGTVLKKHNGGVIEFDPFVRFFSFGESGIELKVFLRVKEYADQFLITSEFIKAIQKRYTSENITIPFPISNVFLNKRAE